MITTLLELAERYPRYGFAKYFVVLRREGYTWNHKRVYRIYRQLQLNMRRKKKHWIDLEFTQPGKPTQNSYVERFNRIFREEVLNFYVFSRLSEVRTIVDAWVQEYNEQRPHESLGNFTPEEFALNMPLSLSLSLSLSSTWPDCVFHVHISFANMLKNAMMRKRQQNRMAFSAKRADKAAPSVAPSAKKTTIS